MPRPPPERARGHARVGPHVAPVGGHGPSPAAPQRRVMPTQTQIPPPATAGRYATCDPPHWLRVSWTPELRPPVRPRSEGRRRAPVRHFTSAGLRRRGKYAWRTQVQRRERRKRRRRARRRLGTAADEARVRVGWRRGTVTCVPMPVPVHTNYSTTPLTAHVPARVPVPPSAAWMAAIDRFLAPTPVASSRQLTHSEVQNILAFLETRPTSRSTPTTA